MVISLLGNVIPTFESGIALQGWEVKSLRLKKVQLVDSYVIIKDGEAFLLGCNVSPLNTTNTHTIADPARTKKLLLHKKELAKLFSATQQKGHTCVCTKMYWKNHLIKCQIALAKGKQSHDKRATVKDREWNHNPRLRANGAIFSPNFCARLPQIIFRRDWKETFQEK